MVEIFFFLPFSAILIVSQICQSSNKLIEICTSESSNLNFEFNLTISKSSQVEISGE